MYDSIPVTFGIPFAIFLLLILIGLKIGDFLILYRDTRKNSGFHITTHYPQKNHQRDTPIFDQMAYERFGESETPV